MQLWTFLWRMKRPWPGKRFHVPGETQQAEAFLQFIRNISSDSGGEKIVKKNNSDQGAIDIRIVAKNTF